MAVGIGFLARYGIGSTVVIVRRCGRHAVVVNGDKALLLLLVAQVVHFVLLLLVVMAAQVICTGKSITQLFLVLPILRL